MDEQRITLANRLVLGIVLFLTIIIGLIVTFFIVVFLFFDDSQPPDYTSYFLDSSPKSEEVFASNPVNIVINANRDMTTNSKVTILKGDEDFGEGEVILDTNKTTIRRGLKPTLGNGEYLVKYTNCFEDGKCGEGQFSFTVDNIKKAEYKNLTGQKEVTIDMSSLKFNPDKIIISPGTKVNWVNKDSVEHFINTDPHPSHTYYLDQNSLDISATGNYSVTFTQAGEYPYHCSAHYPEGMTGRIIVQ